MTQITGIAEFDSRTNKWGFFSVKVNGTYYSTGKTDPGIKKGQAVAFNAEQNDKGYWDVKGGVTVSGAATPAGNKPRATSSIPFPIPPVHGERVIVRQNVLGHATRLVVAAMGTDAKAGAVDKAVPKIIEVAAQFEAYVAGDDLRAKIEAKRAAKAAADAEAAKQAAAAAAASTDGAADTGEFDDEIPF